MKLSEWREQKGMARSELADMIGLSSMQVYRLERGLSRPSPKVMERIVRVTDGAVTPNDFYDLPRVPVPRWGGILADGGETMSGVVSAIASIVGTVFGIRSAKKARRAAAREQARLAAEKEALARRQAFEDRKKAEREQKMAAGLRGRGRRGLLGYLDDGGVQL